MPFLKSVKLFLKRFKKWFLLGVELDKRVVNFNIAHLVPCLFVGGGGERGKERENTDL